jgi:hypothetical protein
MARRADSRTPRRASDEWEKCLGRVNNRWASEYDFFMAKPLRLPNASEQALLDGLNLRLLTDPEAKQRWNELVIVVVEGFVDSR